MVLQTPRLELHALTRETAAAALAGDDALARATGFHIPPGWPPELLDHDAQAWTAKELDRDPTLAGWSSWHVVERETRTLVGIVGLKGPPDADGTVEIGYSVVGAYQGRGIATEASTALVAWAFDDPRVRAVAAETFPHMAASLGVMRRLGMEAAGAGSEEGVVRYVLRRPQA